MAHDAPSSRFKRHQPIKGSSVSNGYDRLMNLTSDEVSLVYNKAAEYIAETRVAYGSALDLLQEQKWLTLGDPVLDAALGGSGIMTHAITEIAGESAVGKTQMCLQLCLTVQLPAHLGGLDGSAVWLSSEGKFPYSRLETMIGHFVSKHKEAIPSLTAEEIRENIYFDSMADQETQLHIFNYQLPVLINDLRAQLEHEPDITQGGHDIGQTGSATKDGNQSRKKPVKLVIIDSIANNLRSDLAVPSSSTYTEDQGGSINSLRTSILQRSADICETGLRLRTVADEHGLAVVCVNQVTDVFRPEGALPAIDSNDSLKTKKPALGLVWENTINARVVLQRTRLPEHQHQELIVDSAIHEPQRTLSVIFSPWAASSSKNIRPMSSGKCWFQIVETGHLIRTMAHHDDYQWHDEYVNPVSDPSTIDIRDLLNDEWEFMTKTDFNPVPLALELMDGSSLGKDYDMFCMILRNIERALKDVVDGSYQGFNASIGTYGGVIDGISDSQSRVKELRMDLKNSKESLRLRHADLVQLYNKSQQYKDMIEMLDEIEELKQVPAKLEVLVREKHFLAAVTLLVSSSKTISKPEMASVGALSDLSRFFNEQLESMAETLMEELHNHLYLKSPYCDSRWATYTTGQEARKIIFFELPEPVFTIGKDLSKLSNDRTKRATGFQSKHKPGNEVRLNDEMITEDLEINPEVDSTYYLEILVESLGLLGKFKEAIVTILQRVPLETYQLIDKTIGEVNERRNAAALKTISARDSNYDDEDDEKYLATKNHENEILRDLFWTLFSKIECIIQGHSTVLIAGQRLLRRVEGDHLKQREMGLVGVKMYSFGEVWTPMLTEIRCLLSDYLMDTNQGEDGPDHFLGGSGHDSGSDLLRSRKANRDKNRQLFKFTDSIGSSSLCKVYDKEIGVFATEPLRKALPQVYAQMTEQGPSLAFSGLIQDKYSQVLAGALANNPVPADGSPAKGAPGSSSQSGSGGAGSGSGGSSSKTAAATANSVPLIPAYLKAAQNGVTGWKSTNASGSSNATTQHLQTSASGHQSLVRPDPAHISVVIRPAVAFVERVRESVPQSREDGTVVVGAFFDHGVINVPMGRF
ncbi:hypothetical protein EC968_009342 [Mortierella alpina]|nr:hypothetical protein EC968_009342 [Mortierella alpina]